MADTDPGAEPKKEDGGENETDDPTTKPTTPPIQPFSFADALKAGKGPSTGVFRPKFNGPIMPALPFKFPQTSPTGRPPSRGIDETFNCPSPILPLPSPILKTPVLAQLEQPSPTLSQASIRSFSNLNPAAQGFIPSPKPAPRRILELRPGEDSDGGSTASVVTVIRIGKDKKEEAKDPAVHQEEEVQEPTDNETKIQTHKKKNKKKKRAKNAVVDESEFSKREVEMRLQVAEFNRGPGLTKQTPAAESVQTQALLSLGADGTGTSTGPSSGALEHQSHHQHPDNRSEFFEPDIADDEDVQSTTESPSKSPRQHRSKNRRRRRRSSAARSLGEHSSQSNIDLSMAYEHQEPKFESKWVPRGQHFAVEMPTYGAQAPQHQQPPPQAYGQAPLGPTFVQQVSYGDGFRQPAIFIKGMYSHPTQQPHPQFFNQQSTHQPRQTQHQTPDRQRQGQQENARSNRPTPERNLSAFHQQNPYAGNPYHFYGPQYQSPPFGHFPPQPLGFQQPHPGPFPLYHPPPPVGFITHPYQQQVAPQFIPGPPPVPEQTFRYFAPPPLLMAQRPEFMSHPLVLPGSYHLGMELPPRHPLDLFRSATPVPCPSPKIIKNLPPVSEEAPALSVGVDEYISKQEELMTWANGKKYEPPAEFVPKVSSDVEETHKEETHQEETHQEETHKEETHQEETHQEETHQEETHQEETHQEETHQEETHQEEAHQEGPHQEEAHHDKKPERPTLAREFTWADDVEEEEEQRAQTEEGSVYDKFVDKKEDQHGLQGSPAIPEVTLDTSALIQKDTVEFGQDFTSIGANTDKNTATTLTAPEGKKRNKSKSKKRRTGAENRSGTSTAVPSRVPSPALSGSSTPFDPTALPFDGSRPVTPTGPALRRQPSVQTIQGPMGSFNAGNVSSGPSLRRQTSGQNLSAQTTAMFNTGGHTLRRQPSSQNLSVPTGPSHGQSLHRRSSHQNLSAPNPTFPPRGSGDRGRHGNYRGRGEPRSTSATYGDHRSGSQGYVPATETASGVRGRLPIAGFGGGMARAERKAGPQEGSAEQGDGDHSKW